MSRPEKLSAGDSYTGFFVEWIEQWSQFVSGCNWYTFHPIKLEIEDDRIMGGVEATVIVLGLGLRVRWNYVEPRHVTRIKRLVAGIKDASPADPIQHPED